MWGVKQPPLEEWNGRRQKKSIHKWKNKIKIGGELRKGKTKVEMEQKIKEKKRSLL